MISAPYAFHFDGQSWAQTNDYAAVDELLVMRHRGQKIYFDTQHFPSVLWPFDPRSVLTGIDYPPIFDFSSPYLVTLDEEGRVWITSR